MNILQKEDVEQVELINPKLLITGVRDVKRAFEPITNESFYNMLNDYPEIKVLIDIMIYNQSMVTLQYFLNEVAPKDLMELDVLSKYLTGIFASVKQMISKEGFIVGYYLADIREEIKIRSDFSSIEDLDTFFSLKKVDRCLNYYPGIDFFFRKYKVAKNGKRTSEENRSSLIKYLVSQHDFYGEVSLPLIGFPIDRIEDVIKLLELNHYFENIVVVYDSNENLSVSVILRNLLYHELIEDYV